MLDDGRFLSAMGDHAGKNGNSYLFVFDPSSKELVRFTDVLSHTDHQPGDWGYGKVHGQIVAGPCGSAYFATYWGTRDDVVYNDRYRGDALFRIDTSSLDVREVAVPIEQRGVPSIAGLRGSDLIYGEAVDPFSKQPNGHEEGDFFVYDTKKRRVVHQSTSSAHSTFRNVLVLGDGRAYVAGEHGNLLEYVPGADSLRDSGIRLPGGQPLRSSTAPAPDGTVYGVTQGEGETPSVIFALDPSGKVRRLTEARGYTASMTLSKDGSTLYYVPGAHGDANLQGTPVIEVDTKTGRDRVLVELNPLAEDALDLTLGGSYDIALDPKRDVLYVGANAGKDSESPWGEVVLSIITLPS